ncbi:hypothetical protein U1Q18_043952 [Sarracenia purpurea var. burkii]
MIFPIIFTFGSLKISENGGPTPSHSWRDDSRQKSGEITSPLGTLLSCSPELAPWFLKFENSSSRFGDGSAKFP